MTIYLGGYLSFYHAQRQSYLEVDADQPSRLVELLNRLDFPLQEVYLVSLNGEKVELQEAVVSEGDNVKLFSAVGGG